MCQSNLHFGRRPPACPPLRSVIKRKSTNYNWRPTAAANNTAKERTAEETQKSQNNATVSLPFALTSAASAAGKMDYVTVSVASEHGRHIGDFVGAGRAKTLEKRLGFGCRHNVNAYISAAIYRDG